MRTLTENTGKTAIGIALMISCLFCMMACAVGCRKEEVPVQSTPTFKEKYIDDFRRIGAKSGEEPYQYGAKIDTVATQMGLDYTDKTMPLMHVYKFDDVYIYDEYLKVYLYLYSKCSDTKETIELRDLLEEYENESDEIMEGKLMVFHQKGGDELTYHYLIEASEAYALYEEQTGEKISGKELKELASEDYIKLEEWALANSDSDVFPTIFRVNASD